MRHGAMMVSIAALLLVTGCAERTTTTSGDTTWSAPADTAGRSRLARLDAEIDSLGARVTNADRRIHDALFGRLERLRARRDSTARAIDALERTGREGWRTAKVHTDSLLGALERSIERARIALRTKDTSATP